MPHCGILILLEGCFFRTGTICWSSISSDDELKNNDDGDCGDDGVSLAVELSNIIVIGPKSGLH